MEEAKMAPDHVAEEEEEEEEEELRVEEISFREAVVAEGCLEVGEEAEEVVVEVVSISEVVMAMDFFQWVQRRWLET